MTLLRTHFKQAILILVFFIAIVTHGFSTTYTYVGYEDENWINPMNWENGTVPPNPLPVGDGITVTGYCYLEVDITINGTLTISSSGHLTIILGVTLVINSGGTLDNDGELYNEGDLYNLGTIDNSGALSNRGMLNNSGILINSGELYNYSGSILTNNSGGTLDNSYFLFNYGFLIIDSGGHLTITSNGNLINYSGSTLTNYLGGAISNSGTLNSSGTLTNSGTLNNSNFLQNLLGILNNSGTLNNSSTLSNYETLTNSGTLINEGVLYNNSTLINDGTLNSFNIIENEGTLNNHSNLFIDGTLNNNGILNNNSGGALTISIGSTLNNYGILNNYNFLQNFFGSLYNDGVVNNFPGGTLDNDRFLYNNHILNNEGALNNDGILNNNLTGILNNNGILNINSGSILTNNSGGTLTNNSGGTLNVNTGSGLNNNGTLNNYGTLKGGGIIVQNANFNNSGIIAPGASPGKLTVYESMDLGTGAYSCEIDGAGQGTTHDWLSISGAATITDATLVVTWGFTPSAGQEFTVLTCGSRTGEFSTVTIPPVSGLTFSVTYAATNVKITAQTALPVVLTNFSGSAIAGSVLLEWNTAMEHNNAGFEVERSSNDQVWSELGFVKSQGAGTASQAYAYTDEHPLSGQNYYRLRQVDLDGKSVYSNIIMVCLKKTTVIRLYPNPAQAYLYTENLSEPADYSIKNATGQTLLSGSLSPGQAIYLQNITPGLYYLCLDQQVIKFVKD